MQKITLERLSLNSLIESGEAINEKRVLAWLLSDSTIEFLKDDQYTVKSAPTYSSTVGESKPLTSPIIALDSASVGVVVAGLSAILAWLSTERRHKDSLSTPPPGYNGGGNNDNPDLCQKVESGRACSLPLLSTMQVKGKGYFFVFRACQKRPEPLTTVEFFQL